MVRNACGRHGVQVLEATETACCRGSNPIGILFFAVLYVGCYWGVHIGVFPLLDGNDVSLWHRYAGMAVATLILYFFIMAAFGDPGKITSQNIDAMLQLYPSDGILFPKPPIQCTTCRRLKPARSKHCNATKACVARFDHWCIWINNAVGLYNTRHFLFFLLTTSVACAYGAIVGVWVIAADMRRRGAWDTTWVDPKNGGLIKLGDRWTLVVQFVLGRYPGATIVAFFAIAFWIVLGFTIAQVRRICEGVTTNESFKIKELGDDAFVLEQARQAYNRGWKRNLLEVLWYEKYSGCGGGVGVGVGGGEEKKDR